MRQIIRTFFNQFFHSGINFQINADLKMLQKLRLIIGHTEAAAAENDAGAFSFAETVTDPGRYVAAHHYLGMQAAEKERVRILNRLAEEFGVELYTRSDTSCLRHVPYSDTIRSISVSLF